MPLDRPSLRRRGPLPALAWRRCAVGLSALLLACGGRAADGPEPEVKAPDVSSPPDDEEPSVVRPVRETCADNPLLAGCPYASMGSSAPSPAIDVEPAPAPTNEPQWVTRARNVLSSYCGPCHGSALTESQASGTINYIDDWNQLIEVGLIERCSPDSSRIVEVMRTGDMPPATSGWDAVSDSDIVLVQEAIELDCKYR